MQHMQLIMANKVLLVVVQQLFRHLPLFRSSECDITIRDLPTTSTLKKVSHYDLTVQSPTSCSRESPFPTTEHLAIGVY